MCGIAAGIRAVLSGKSEVQSYLSFTYSLVGFCNNRPETSGFSGNTTHGLVLTEPMRM